MKDIRFQKIMLLSYAEKKARTIDLDSDFVLIKGTNHVGKSCILKSLYRALGAEIKKIPESWNVTNVIVILCFTIDGVCFKTMLVGNDLYIINPDNSFRCKEKVGSERLNKEINSLLGVDLRVIDDSCKTISVGTNYLPFYIDQDSGWIETWSSFCNVGSIGDKSYVRQYLTGIVDESYFARKKELSKVEKQIKKYESELNSFRMLSGEVSEKFSDLKLDICIDDFKDRIESYLNNAKLLRETQNKHLRLMQELYSKKAHIEANIEQLRNNISEIEKDFKYALELGEVVICPTCGGKYSNNMIDRHELIQDDHTCRDMIIRYKTELDNVNKQIEVVTEKLNEINKEIEDANNSIKAKDEGVSLEEVIDAKSRKQVLELIKVQSTEIVAKLADLKNERERLDGIIKGYDNSGRKEEAEKLFDEYVTTAIKEMGAKSNNGKVKFGGRISATGSTLPVNIIAHTFSYLQLMLKYSGPLFMPVVVDEPKQQGLQKQGLSLTITYMLKTLRNKGQLILSLAESSEIQLPANAKIFDLDETKRVLIEDDYEAVHSEVDYILDKDFEHSWNCKGNN